MGQLNVKICYLRDIQQVYGAKSDFDCSQFVNYY